VDQQPACRELRAYIGASGKKGSEIRKHFGAPPYGWPQDAIDGALLALLAAGFLRATRAGQPQAAKQLDRSHISSTEFVSEGATVSAMQRLAVRTLIKDLGLAC